MFIVTVAAASAEWTDPSASAAGLAREWAAAGQAVALLDTAPRVHRVGESLGVETCAGVDELLMELELAAPGDGPRIRVAEAEGWSERGSRLKQIWRGLERAGIDAVLVCCTVDQGGWLRELLADSQRLVLVSGPLADHAHDLVRLVPLAETPRYLLIAADGPLPARGQPDHPERVAAAARVPLAATLGTDTADTALADFARRLLAELAPAAATNPPAAPPAEPDPPAAPAAEPDPSAALRAEPDPSAAPPAEPDPAPTAAAPDPPAAAEPATSPEAAAAALPGETPGAGDALPMLVPAEAWAAVSALLALWPLRSRMAELDHQVGAAAAAVYDLTSNLQRGMLTAGTDTDHLARHFAGAMRAREELAGLRAERRELEQAYRVQVEAFCRELDLPQSDIGSGQDQSDIGSGQGQSDIGGGQGHHAGSHDVYEAVVR